MIYFISDEIDTHHKAFWGEGETCNGKNPRGWSA
jgi:hypothetical protein